MYYAYNIICQDSKTSLSFDNGSNGEEGMRYSTNTSYTPFTHLITVHQTNAWVRRTINSWSTGVCGFDLKWVIFKCFVVITLIIIPVSLPLDEWHMTLMMIALLKLSDLLELSALKFYFKYLHGSLHRFFYSFNIATEGTQHSHDTRQCDQLRVQRSRINIADNRIRIFLPTLVNSTPLIIFQSIRVL